MSDLGDNEDWRIAELRRLGDAERGLTTELANTRDAIARLVVQLLPPHAPAARIEPVVQASGYARWMIDKMRDGKLWLRQLRSCSWAPPPPEGGCRVTKGMALTSGSVAGGPS